MALRNWNEEERRYETLVCDLTGYTMQTKGADNNWFEYAGSDEGHNYDMNQHDWATCEKCDRTYHMESALPLLKQASLEDGGWRDPTYSWHCGECTTGGIFHMRARAHGIVVRYDDEEMSMKGDDVRIIHNSHSQYEGGDDALLYRIQELIDNIDDDTCGVRDIPLFDFEFDRDDGWCYKGDKIQGHQYSFVDVPAFQKFMDYFMAHFMHWKIQFHPYSSGTTRYRGHAKSYSYEYYLSVYNWRYNDDGIGGYGTPILFTINKKDKYLGGDVVYVLCKQEAEGWEDHWHNADSFNPLDLFTTMLNDMAMRHDYPYEDY